MLPGLARRSAVLRVDESAAGAVDKVGTGLHGGHGGRVRGVADNDPSGSSRGNVDIVVADTHHCGHRTRERIIARTDEACPAPRDRGPTAAASVGWAGRGDAVDELHGVACGLDHRHGSPGFETDLRRHLEISLGEGDHMLEHLAEATFDLGIG